MEAESELVAGTELGTSVCALDERVYALDWANGEGKRLGILARKKLRPGQCRHG